MAIVGGDVVADATLNRHSRIARQHVAEIGIVVDPKYRNQGLGSVMVKELIDVAKRFGFERLIFEQVAERHIQANYLSKELGFVMVATLSEHVRDLHNKYHDLIIMELYLNHPQEETRRV